jgi:hypothetical protein
MGVVVANGERMFNRLKQGLGVKAVALGLALALLGGGVAAAATGSLPEPAQEALAAVAERITDIYGDSEDTVEGEETEVVLVDGETTATETSDLTEGDIGHPMDNGEGVPQEVKDYFANLMIWIGCIQDAVQEGTAAHAEKQSGPDRVEDAEFDDEAAKAECGPKPINLNDSEEELEETDGEGMPEEVQIFLAELHTWIGCIQEGARAHAEQQSGPDRVENAEFTPDCPDKPTNPNDNGEGGEIEGEGRPEDAGPPPWAGGPPPWAGGADRP